jgi:molecular chaperone DnaJ
MDGAGEAVSGASSGDLYIHIQVESHSLFKRMGNDLIMPLEIKLVDALLGKNIEIETLDGKEILEIPEGTTTGDQLKIRHKGISHGRGRGDIIVGVKVAMPRRISKKAKELIEQLRAEL